MPRRPTLLRRAFNGLAELAGYALAVFFDSPEIAQISDRPPREHLFNKARVRRRDRALRRWLAKTNGVGPIPDVGLRCENCRFSLTGLLERRCPECGRPFDLEKMLDTRYP